MIREKDKKLTFRIYASLWVCLCISFLSACASNNTETTALDITAEDAFEKIKVLSKQANDKSSLEMLIKLHEAVLVENPSDKASLRSLAQLHTLMGAGFSHSKSKKKENFKKAMFYSQEIMLLNPEFSERVNRGETIWAASDALTRKESDGLGWWSTAMLYYYKEVIPNIFKPINYRLVVRSKKMMDQIEKVDPEWEGGSNYFNLAIYYHALPEIAGGDYNISQQYLEKAKKAGPTRLLFPWGVAKYFYPTRIDYNNFKKRLDWVLAQDVNQENGEHYAWRVYFKEQASELLRQTPAG